MAFWKLWRTMADQQQQMLQNSLVAQQKTDSQPMMFVWHSESTLGIPDHVARWEGLPLTAVDNIVETEDGPTLVQETIDEEEEKKDDSLKKNPIKLLRMAVPHIILLSVLLSYVAAGAAILQRLENGTETTRRYNKLVELDRIFKWVINETWDIHVKSKNMAYNDWNVQVYDRLQNISVFYFKRKLNNKDQLPLETQWTFPTAVLYTLTVLTACGYSHIDPVTNEGMIFAVAFALLGIPLMFITAADIGKFLSETFTKIVHLCTKFYRAVMWKCCRRRMKEREKAAAARDALEEIMAGGDPDKSPLDMHMDSLWFPIGAYVFLMCLYCTIGAILFRNYETWGFIHAFHFAFNTVVTVGMGDVVVTDPFYLCLVVAYVIIGLAVVTMCVDLASSHLQAYFQKIHYFGRARKHFMDMSDEIREMMAVIAAMRKKKGSKVTWNDLKQFLEAEAIRDRNKSFYPRNAHQWKYIDETSSAVSTYRHNSVNSYSSMTSGTAGSSGPPPPPPMPRRTSQYRTAAGIFADRSGVYSDRSEPQGV